MHSVPKFLPILFTLYCGRYCEYTFCITDFRVDGSELKFTRRTNVSRLPLALFGHADIFGRTCQVFDIYSPLNNLQNIRETGTFVIKFLK